MITKQKCNASAESLFTIIIILVKIYFVLVHFPKVKTREFFTLRICRISHSKHTLARVFCSVPRNDTPILKIHDMQDFVGNCIRNNNNNYICICFQLAIKGSERRISCLFLSCNSDSSFPSPLPLQRKLLQSNYVNETDWEYSKQDKTLDH